VGGKYNWLGRYILASLQPLVAAKVKRSSGFEGFRRATGDARTIQLRA